jgi:hypothetical protein
MPKPPETGGIAEFQRVLDQLSEESLLFLMDDYKAALCCWSRGRGTPIPSGWWQHRINQITEEYGIRQQQDVLF